MYNSFAAGVTLNNHRAAGPLVGLMKKEKRGGAPDQPQGFLPLNWGGTEQNRIVTCMVLKAKANGRRTNLAHHRDEFRGP
ncbi:hypothetical protein TNCV_2109441 [Trichonephila clavipes]|nr:hypothetical protein TNCV_2109441 [Trichonephila clavipes]